MWDRPRSSPERLCATVILSATLIAIVTLAPAAPGQSTSWKGTASTSWSNATNWTGGAPSGTTAVAFDSNSTANLATNNDVVGLTPTAMTVANPTGPVSIGGNGLSIGSGGIDMSVSTQPLTIALTAGQTITLGASQTWRPAIGSGQTLTISSPIAGAAGVDLTINGGLATFTNTASIYAGRTIIQNGTIEVTLLANLSTASSIGAPTTVPNGTIALGNAANTGTLRYVGSTNGSTDRVLNLAGTTGGGTLDASGTGTVTFTSDLTATGAGSKTVTVTGSNTGPNTIAAIIPDNSPANTTALLKTGPGTWVLNAANTYSGGTTITDGTLRVNGTSGNAPVTVTGTGTVGSGGTLGGTGSVGAPTISSTTPGSQGGTLSPGNNNIGALAAGGNTTFNPLGRYLFEYNAAATSPVPGTDNDLIQGTILNLSNLSATPAGQFTVTLRPVAGSVGTSPVSYVAGTFTTVTLPGGVTDINTLFTFTGSFAGTPTASFTGGELRFSFVPVPEPVHVLLACASVAGLVGWRRRI